MKGAVMKDIMIVMEGGVIQNVFSTDPDINVVIRDFDVDDDEEVCQIIDGERCIQYLHKTILVETLP